MDQIATIATLVFLLASLLVVYQARREAHKEREAARLDTQAIRDEVKRAQADVARREERVAAAEAELATERKNLQLQAKQLEDRVALVATADAATHERRDELERAHREALARVAGLTVEEAREELEARLLAEARSRVSLEVHRLTKKAKETATERATEVLVEAMQRQVGPSTSSGAVTRIELPSDEMKGRIIGREGRNIRAFEALTGVNVIVDEGVNAVLLSSFDLERREVAEVALRALVEDGRIQPHRVEAAFAKALADAPARAREAALEAVDKAGVGAVAEPLLELLGALRLRTSYNQNVLAHLVEASTIARAIAQQVGADEVVAARAAFLHDVGKALAGVRQGTHALVGAAVAKEAGESPAVVAAIAAHHDEVPQESIEGVIVQIADAISAARPGARNQDIENYVERMESLEESIAAFAGVDHVYAMASGRELRVAVKPDVLSDEGAAELARTLVQHIEKEASFAGEIKVTIIRETRVDVVAG